MRPDQEPEPPLARRHPEASIESRNMVLGRMLELGISREQYLALKQKPMVTRAQSAIDSQFTYVFEEVRQDVMKLVGEAAPASAASRFTPRSIPPCKRRPRSRAQTPQPSGVAAGVQAPDVRAVQKVADYKDKISGGAIDPATPTPKPEYLQGAALVMDNKDGSILVMVGGRASSSTASSTGHEPLRDPPHAASRHGVSAVCVRRRFQQAGLFPRQPARRHAHQQSARDDRRPDRHPRRVGCGGGGVEMVDGTHQRARVARELAQRHHRAPRREGGPSRAQGFRGEGRRPVGDQGLPLQLPRCQQAYLDETAPARPYLIFPNLGQRPKEMHCIDRITDAEDKVVFQVSEDIENTVQAADPVACYQTHSCCPRRGAAPRHGQPGGG